MQRPLVTRALLGLTLGLGGMFGAAAAASAAGTVSQVSVSDGALLAKGAAITVPITYCTGDVQSTTLTVLPDSGSRAAFRSGVALAFVSLTACDDASFTGCSSMTREAVEFRLGNK